MVISRARLDFKYDLERFPQATRWVADLGWKPLAVPIVFLAAGLFGLFRRKDTAVELVVGLEWLFALLWIAWCLLVCLLPEIPTS